MTGTSSDVAFADAYLKGVTVRRRGGVRGGGEERHRRAADAGRRPQGHGHARRSSATRAPSTDEGCPGRWRATSTTSASRTWRRRCDSEDERRRASEYKEESEYFLNRAPELRHALRPDRSASSRARTPTGDWRRAPSDVRPADLGLRLHRDQRLGLRLHRAAGRPGPGQPLRRPGRPGEEARRRSSPPRRPPPRVRRLLRRRHPRDDRGARRPDGPVRPQQPAVAPHHRTCTTRRAAVEDAGEGARGARPGSTPAARSARATPATRTTASMSAWYLFSALGFYPLLMGSADVRDRLAAVHQGDGPPGDGSDLVDQRAGQQREEHLRAGPEGQRQGVDLGPLPHSIARQGRRAGVRHGRRAVGRLGAPADAAPPSVTSRARRPMPGVDVDRGRFAVTARPARARTSARLIDNTRPAR